MYFRICTLARASLASAASLRGSPSLRPTQNNVLMLVHFGAQFIKVPVALDLKRAIKREVRTTGTRKEVSYSDFFKFFIISAMDLV